MVVRRFLSRALMAVLAGAPLSAMAVLLAGVPLCLTGCLTSPVGTSASNGFEVRYYRPATVEVHSSTVVGQSSGLPSLTPTATVSGPVQGAGVDFQPAGTVMVAPAAVSGVPCGPTAGASMSYVRPRASERASGCTIEDLCAKVDALQAAQARARPEALPMPQAPK